MTPERYEELLGRLLDGEITPAEGEALAAALRADPVRRRDCRHHLELWDLHAQQLAPERSAESFMAAWNTRCQAEREAVPFITGLWERISRETGCGNAKRAAGLPGWWASVTSAQGWVATNSPSLWLTPAKSPG